MRKHWLLAALHLAALTSCREKKPKEEVVDLSSPSGVCNALKKEGVAAACIPVELPVHSAEFMNAKHAVKFDGAGLAIAPGGETAKPGQGESTEVHVIEYESRLKMDETIDKLTRLDWQLLIKMGIDPDKVNDKRGRWCRVLDLPIVVHVPSVSNDSSARARMAAIERVTGHSCPPPSN